MSFGAVVPQSTIVVAKTGFIGRERVHHPCTYCMKENSRLTSMKDHCRRTGYIGQLAGFADVWVGSSV